MSKRERTKLQTKIRRLGRIIGELEHWQRMYSSDDDAPYSLDMKAKDDLMRLLSLLEQKLMDEF